MRQLRKPPRSDFGKNNSSISPALFFLKGFETLINSVPVCIAASIQTHSGLEMPFPTKQKPGLFREVISGLCQEMYKMSLKHQFCSISEFIVTAFYITDIFRIEKNK